MAAAKMSAAAVAMVTAEAKARVTAMATATVTVMAMVMVRAMVFVSCKHSTLDVCTVNKVCKYHSMRKMVDSVYVAVKTQQRVYH
jgi:hypothetical protein